LVSVDGRVVEINEIPRTKVWTDSETGLTHRDSIDPIYTTDDGLPVEKIGSREFRIPARGNLVFMESFSLL
jgi:hypothetical protein